MRVNKLTGLCWRMSWIFLLKSGWVKWSVMRMTSKISCSRILQSTTLSRLKAGFLRTHAQITWLRYLELRRFLSLSICIYVWLFLNGWCFFQKAEECLKREKERVGHYLHISSEQKLLEVCAKSFLFQFCSISSINILFAANISVLNSECCYVFLE